MNRSRRFTILARDKFTCQYCGAKAPSVALEVDHLIPRSRGGRDVAANLVTACFDCNRGKRTAMLDAALVKRYSIGRAVVKQTSRHQAAKPAPLPVAMAFVYTGPDEFLPKFRCAVCGMVNEHERDTCGCGKREAESVLCTECLEELDQHEIADGVCGECYELVR